VPAAIAGHLPDEEAAIVPATEQVPTPARGELVQQARPGCNPKGSAADQRLDQAFLVGAGFTVAAAILPAVLISPRDSREPSKAARSGEAADADDAAVPAVAGIALQPTWRS
jgi:glutathione S-transferase